MKFNKKQTIAYAILYGLLCLVYIVIYMPFGFEDTDTGYILGSSWNIYNGQLPHRDFIYTRPAIPAYFHTLFIWISETYAFILDRSFFYVQIFIYSYFGAALLCQKFKIKDIQTRYFIAILGAIVSIHNYPPMGWNTVDGVFFCVLGIYAILHDPAKLYKIALGSFLLVLSVFSKQSFYFMPIFLFAYLLLLKDFKRLRWYVVFGLLAVGSYVLFKFANKSLVPFWEQTFQRTPTSALTDAGIKTYYHAFKYNFVYVLVAFTSMLLAKRYLKNNISYIIFIACILSLITFFFTQTYGAWETIPFIFQILVVLCGLFAFTKLLTDKRYYLLLLLLALSWSASISNGYRTPIHFSIPVIFGSYLFFFNSNSEKIKTWTRVSSIILCFITFFYGYQTVYRDSNRDQLSYEMGTLYPELTFIKSDEATFKKYKELKSFSLKYPNFTALPSATLAHFLTKTKNPIGVDWPLDVEINNEAIQLVNKLAKKEVTVFLEVKDYTQYQLDGYTIKKIIEADWVLVEKGSYFNIYKSK